MTSLLNSEQKPQIREWLLKNNPPTLKVIFSVLPDLVGMTSVFISGSHTSSQSISELKITSRRPENLWEHLQLPFVSNWQVRWILQKSGSRIPTNIHVGMVPQISGAKTHPTHSNNGSLLSISCVGLQLDREPCESGSGCAASCALHPGFTSDSTGFSSLVGVTTGEFASLQKALRECIICDSQTAPEQIFFSWPCGEQASNHWAQFWPSVWPLATTASNFAAEIRPHLLLSAAFSIFSRRCSRAESFMEAISASSSSTTMSTE